MKTKDYVLIGGAVALLLLWQKNKTKKLSTSATTGGATTGGVTTGGATIGGVTTGGVTTGGGTSTSGTSQVTSFPTPTSSEPEQVFGLGLPTGMDLPILTAGTGVPTEVAVQQGGVVTELTPAVVTQPPLEIEESLLLGNIKPIPKPAFNPSAITVTEPIIVVPFVKPTLTKPELID